MNETLNTLYVVSVGLFLANFILAVYRGKPLPMLVHYAIAAWITGAAVCFIYWHAPVALTVSLVIYGLVTVAWIVTVHHERRQWRGILQQLPRLQGYYDA